MPYTINNIKTLLNVITTHCSECSSISIDYLDKKDHCIFAAMVEELKQQGYIRCKILSDETPLDCSSNLHDFFIFRLTPSGDSLITVLNKIDKHLKSKEIYTKEFDTVHELIRTIAILARPFPDQG